MRIISGTAKGTKLYTLDGLNTRPTLDRVKESIFNIIQNDIKDSKVLDLFSGSGAIGLEFASRGSSFVYLCDNSKDACEIIKKNIIKTHLEEKTKLYHLDYLIFIKKIKNEKFDIVFLDPPYKTDFIEKAIKELIKGNNIDNKTTIIVETDEEKIIENILNIKELYLMDKRKYGRVFILLLKKVDRKDEG